ncbi:hypothetical protein ParaMal1_00034 [Paracoccus phage ParMal1]|uniref:Uncharacterized protein n=1 Tax=Paracoccus phage ParMal1 TaxID=3032416 RepID=A0AAF0JQ75_9CAUD|nr:hypothetical protein ParaMal1_00034 [Paracoccus phage ParMal1]
MTLQDTIREATSMAEHYEGEAQRLSQQYSGVRPGWVSTDIAIAQSRAASYRKMVEELKEASDEAAD